MERAQSRCPTCLIQHDKWLGVLCPKCYVAVHPPSALRCGSIVHAYTYVNALQNYSKYNELEKMTAIREVLCPKVKLLSV
jgi:NMD protein affecting ribosome stability and mRNA decay